MLIRVCYKVRNVIPSLRSRVGLSGINRAVSSLIGWLCKFITTVCVMLTFGGPYDCRRNGSLSTTFHQFRVQTEVADDLLCHVLCKATEETLSAVLVREVHASYFSL